MLKLSDVDIGQPQKPTAWSNSLQENIEIDYKEQFVQTIKESNHKRDYQKEGWDGKIKMVDDTLLPNAAHYHTNYLNYLEKCWADHLGIVITPDIVWYTILCEFASIVKSEPETYRSLFTYSKEKQEIIVVSGSLTTMPLDMLVTTLQSVVPSDTGIFFPSFQEFTANSKHAYLAAFCDICSPYYNYMMLLCGFPLIDIRGTKDDWKLLKDQWEQLKKIIQDNKWMNAVSYVLDDILINFSNSEFWKKMFTLDRCGSGHQTKVSGWFTNLFKEQPEVKYAENFSSHVSNIKYKQLDTQKDYEMSVGLFSSVLKENCMEPSFSSMVYDVTGVRA